MDSLWNTTCPDCGFKAYKGLNSIECSNKTCKRYKKPAKDDDETKIIEPSEHGTCPGCDYDGYGHDNCSGNCSDGLDMIG